MFDSNNFKDINYLNFDPKFKIDVKDKIKIIFGPNGTGKTSLYRNIQGRFSNYSFIDYNDVEKSVISKKDKITIGASILLLNDEKNKKNVILENIDVKNNLKEFNITNKKSAENISKELELLRNNQELAIKEFNINNLNILFSMDDNKKDLFNNNAKLLIEQNEIKIEIEDIKNNFRKNFLEEINHYLEDDDKMCPVCGAEYSESMKSIIAKKIAEIKNIDNELVKTYQQKHPELKPAELLSDIEKTKNIIMENEISIKDLQNYLICGGSAEKSKLIVNSKKELEKINNNIEKLEIEKTKFYNNLNQHKDSLYSIFRIQLGVAEESIIFDDINKEITIKLPRKIEEYSTGEINLITFVVCILEFISSDRDTLIIDDPLSSYDIPNQYKIMYEIVSAKDKDKKILIFTHNIDTLNIANTQFNKMFEYETIEKNKNTLYINSIDYETSKNILDFNEILLHLDHNNVYYNYIMLLKQKETWDGTDERHLLFHYDEPYSKVIDGFKYENDFFANLIDNFTADTFENISYIDNTTNKIIYTAALRIWIEKQFYLNSINDSGLYTMQFGDKIKYMFSSNRWKGSSNVSQKYLMSKKVMLNQHIHQNSQVMPFYFSLNLTLDDISKEILDIKEHFIIK